MHIPRKEVEGGDKRMKYRQRRDMGSNE